MSTRTPAPKPKNPAAPKRAASTPVVQRQTRRRRDWWPWNLMGVLVLLILGTGVIVWSLRRAVASSPQPAAAPTAVPTEVLPTALPSPVPAAGTPVLGGLADLATPTLAAPDALINGPYGATTPVASTVGVVNSQQIGPILPPALPAPHLALSEEGHDWGTIDGSSVVTQAITVANIGNRPLHINQLVSSCSCLDAALSSQDLPVGRRATLVVRYDAGRDGKKGPVSRTLTILSTAGDIPSKELTFRATVR